ncbi:MAG: hypothetical protein HFE46_00975 [Clostridia bacterium]|nr:hypothetical protein [Clostridia bacterium]
METDMQVSSQTDGIAIDQNNVMRFLVLNDFKQGSLHTIKNISLLIAKNMHETLDELKNEYALLCAVSETPDTVRAKLIYCVRQNHDALRESVKRAYNFDMGKFYGIKAFIDQMSIIYSLFAAK